MNMIRHHDTIKEMIPLAIEVTLQPQDKSYKEADLKAISDAVVAAAAKQGAELRG